MKKLKRQYRHSLKRTWRGFLWDYYPAIRSAVHKHFSTKQEKSYYFLHEKECSLFPVKLRAKRGGALADPWDDYPSSVYDLAKSWKHNSRRRNQYFR